MKKIIEIMYKNAQENDDIIKEIYTFTHTVMVKSKRLGISSQWAGFPGEINNCQKYACYDHFIGKKVSDTFLELINGSPREVSIAMATLNSVIPIPDNIKAGNVFDELYPIVKNEKTVFIGHFPRAEKWKREGLDISIVELVPRPGDIHWNKADKVLEESSIVFITGITLLNKTFMDVIKKTPNAIYRVLMGPTVAVLKEFLDFGIDFVGGTYIENEDLAIKYWQRGGAGMRKAPKGAVRSIFISK